MLHPRIIPCLLIHRGGLVKTTNFRNPKYVGDPINAVRIFNEKHADELMVLDMDATVNNVEPNYSLIAKLAAESRMPLCYGGGIVSSVQAARIISLGVEKISISAAALANPSMLSEIAAAIGRQSVVVVIDVRKKSSLFNQSYEVCTHNARNTHKVDLGALLQQLQEAGAGEIVINAIHCDGQMHGYDIDLAQQVRAFVNVPLTILGGAGSLSHLSDLFRACGMVGAAAGSLFLFKGPYRAVLITYPTSSQKEYVFQEASLTTGNI